MAKGHDTFCPVGPVVPAAEFGAPEEARLWLTVNGETRQSGAAADMLFSVPALIEYVSSIFTLEEHDLLLTGTPEGVSRFVAGDEMTAAVVGQGGVASEVRVGVVDRA